MNKINKKFVEEFGSGFTKTIEDFTDDDYQYKKWLLEIQPDSNKPINMEDLDILKTINNLTKDKNENSVDEYCLKNNIDRYLQTK